jgi:hypothetical protein
MLWSEVVRLGKNTEMNLISSLLLISTEKIRFRLFTVDNSLSRKFSSGFSGYNRSWFVLLTSLLVQYFISIPTANCGWSSTRIYSHIGGDEPQKASSFASRAHQIGFLPKEIHRIAFLYTPVRLDHLFRELNVTRFPFSYGRYGCQH